MDIETRKLHLIEWLAKTQDEQLLARIEQMVQGAPVKQYQNVLGDGSDDAQCSLKRPRLRQNHNQPLGWHITCKTLALRKSNRPI